MTAGSPGAVQSVDRALDVLETLADAGGELGLTEIATRTGLPYGTIHRLLRTLVARGYVRQGAARRYALGGSLLRLHGGAERLLGAGAHPYLRRLVALTGETANLAVLDGDAAVYVAQVPSPRRLRMFAEVGRRVMTHCTAVGKVLLAHRPAEEAAAVVRRAGLPARTERTITSAEALLAELAEVRARGFALDEGEEEVEVRCLAVPVRDGERVVAALSVSGPAARMEAGPVSSGGVAGTAAAMSRIAAAFAAEMFPGSPGRSQRAAGPPVSR